MDLPEAQKSDVAPATASAYLDPNYWDRRFEQEEHYEWFKDYSHFRHLILQYIKPNSAVLEVGCGNSQLSEELYRDGITELTCIDLSSIAVEKMKQRLLSKGYKEIKVLEADMLDLPFGDECFDVVVEKGTMDVLFVDSGDPWNPEPATVSKVMAMLEGVHRVLKPHGIFISITFGQPHFRRPFFNAAAFTCEQGERASDNAEHAAKFNPSLHGHQTRNDLQYALAESCFKPKPCGSMVDINLKFRMLVACACQLNFAGNLPLTDFRNRSQLLKSKTLIFSAYYLYIHALSCIESDQDKYWVMEDDYYLSGGSEEEDDYYPSDREAESLDGLENEESDAQWATSKAPSSKVITKESLLAAQREDLRRVMELLSVREHHARTLLIHYRWDVEKLIAVYVEKGKSCMFSEAGVSVIELVDLDPPESSSTLVCNICMDDVPAKDVTKMDCDTAFATIFHFCFSPQFWTPLVLYCLVIVYRQIFSWLCGGATGRDHTWSHIANHSCGRYKEDGEKKAERAKRDLYRYMHYHNRYKAHTDSFKQESRLRETKRKSITFGSKGLKVKRLQLDYKWALQAFSDQDELSRMNVSRMTLLGSLQYTIHIIAPYQSKGIAKAEELTWSAQANSNNKCQKISDQSTGDLIEIGKASASGTSDESPQLSRKRPRKGSSTGSMFDLNLPAELRRLDVLHAPCGENDAVSRVRRRMTASFNIGLVTESGRGHADEEGRESDVICSTNMMAEREVQKQPWRPLVLIRRATGPGV
ncbi:UNVERIFIED_CONTAM: putative E3 ubiquitin-protein ligase ARI1 [Sesamum calycinum]|uniref:E3 ubiquitin-protein ligase ARI1 n=1 Tax=Sesamum calycinum TaxID=2727403 RepID=A0AAW2PLR7_9LAMI